MLPLIVSVNDASDFGFTLTTAALARASARVRGYTRQQITPGSSTITARGPIVLLPQRPTTAVSAVYEHGHYDLPPDNVWFELEGNILTTRSIRALTVTYSHGFDQIPDDLAEVVCTIAERLTNINPALAAGLTSESGGNESASFGFDSYNAITDLATGEKRVLDRIFPNLASTVVLRP